MHYLLDLSLVLQTDIRTISFPSTKDILKSFFSSVPFKQNTVRTKPTTHFAHESDGQLIHDQLVLNESKK
jgi:hypothetical protein